MSPCLLVFSSMDKRLADIYSRLYAHFGAQHWWPQNDGAFEIIVGAILTQNTAWTNVEKALANQKPARALTPARLHHVPAARLARWIRPSGYFNLKAKKLHAFTQFLYANHRGSLTRLFKLDTPTLREQLLAVYGIGPETADSIILYAAQKPIFVVDAYTRRICARLGLAREDLTYEELQYLFMEHLPRDEKLFNEYHALLVALGKHICKKTVPRCAQCPLVEVCPTGQKNGTRMAVAALRHSHADERG
ncbi:Endonuclease III [Anaerolineae bacterium]|nr:Endonuclease III [Anaerolineae bacterium]